MQCPKCQFENRDGVRFCEECGTKLEQVCSGCGNPVPPGRKFCGNCGQPLTAAPPPPTKYTSPQSYTPKLLAEKILTSKSAMEGERKNVTVMFADVSSFTAISELLDPEDIHTIMDRAFEVILNVVHRFEGTINQFLGDGVMALFGAPIAHEDHVHRALRAALAIQEALQPLREQVQAARGVEFRMRMGINTGFVVVGAIGKDLRMDYTAVGDTTNLAARLLAVAQPGQIVVSGRTQRFQDGFFVFDDLGEFQLKGKAEAVRAYALTGEIHGRTRLEASKTRGLTPRSGRERELARLMDAYRRAAGGKGAVVLVAGEPGMGKSRLLYEFMRGLDGSEVVWLEATCQSHTRSMPYHPILELVRRHLGLAEGEVAGEIRSRIAERFQPPATIEQEAEILLAHFLGVPAPSEFLTYLGPQLRVRTFRVLRELLLQASQSAPLVLILENLHWIDSSSEEFLKDLTSHLPGQRVLLILTARPSFSVSWLDALLAERIILEGLEVEHVRQMIQTLLGVERVSSQLLEILSGKAEGNPLYLEEILRQLQESERVVIDGDEARLRGADVKVPDTIHDIIAARIDRLAEPVKHTLQVAAVVGREFALPLLSRVVESNGALPDRLRELQTLGFVFLSGGAREPVYSFKHALTHDVAYGSLLERRRAVYHAAVGRGLEELYAGASTEVVELLAYHFGHSGEAEKAVDYAILAAEKAQRSWANTEALVYFEDALKRLAGMPDTQPNRLRRIDAVVKQAEIKFALGRHAEHIQALEAIRDIVDAAADPRRRAAWYCWTGFLHSLTGARPEVTIGFCREASAIAEAEGLDEIRAMAESCLAQVHVVAGNLREALAAGQRALTSFEARGNVWWACRTLWHLCSATSHLGEWDRSLEYCRRALEHGQAVNDRRLKVVGWWRTGWAHIQRGDLDTGLRCCEEALALLPIPFDAAMVKAAQGYGLVKAGDAPAGTEKLAEAVAWFNQSQILYTRSWFAIWLGEGYLRQGETLQARTLLEDLLATSREVGYRHLEGVIERLLGESLMPDDPVEAASHLEAAARTLEEVGARNELGKTLAARAELSRAAGDLAGARQSLERALKIFEELGTLDEPPRLRAALAGLEHPVAA